MSPPRRAKDDDALAEDLDARVDALVRKDSDDTEDPPGAAAHDSEDAHDAPRAAHDSEDNEDPPGAAAHDAKEPRTSSDTPSPTDASVRGGAGLQDAITRIWARSRDTVTARVVTIERAARHMLEGRLDPALRADAAHEAHRLAGSLGTFGFPRGSSMARELEHLFAGTGPPPPADVLRACELADRLRTEIQQPPGRDASRDERRSTTGAVLMISDDDALVGRLRHRLEAWGLDVSRAPLAPTAGPTADHDLVVVDLGPSEDPGAQAALLRSVPARAGAAAVVVLAATLSDATRIEAARVGARRIINRASAPELIVDATRGILARPRDSPAHVLLAGDPKRSEVHEAFDDPRLAVTGTTDTETFLHALTDERPEIVVIDADHPGIDVALFGHLVRMDPRWEALPLVLLARTTSTAQFELAARLQADAIITIPLPPRSADRLVVELERARVHSPGHEPTASPDASDTTSLEHLLQRAGSNDRRVSVVRVLWRADPATRPAPGARSAAAALAKRLDAKLGAGDLVIRDEDGLVIALYDTAPDAAATWIEAALRSAGNADGAPATLSPRAGIAAFPEDGKRGADLVAAAAARVPRFHTDLVVGRSTGAPTSGDERATDILLIDDDETLGALLTHALGARGYRVQWLADGIDAANQLLGPKPKLKPRLILLDVNLPSLDGLSLLRRFRDTGYLEGVKVIMLTARVREAEVVEALSLGAHDHVGKPFSVPVLAERIRQVLEA